MKKMFVMLAVATSMVLGSCGGDDAKGDDAKSGDAAKGGAALTVCDCVNLGKEIMKEMESVGGDAAKAKEIEEKYKKKADECREMEKNASEEDQKKMMEEARNC